ncbi:N-terminal acetyltransferase [Tulasnella sp. 331]|nr:N-terminal acetyltransferase [Tulasnella sp. 331]KAG8881428.1 N-terminal acetyltransferase [Tulasnella sp. 332]
MPQIRPTSSCYSDEQLTTYLLHIGVPSAVDDELSLDSVERIIRHHVTTIPFDNTEMHYTQSGYINSDPQVVYTRVITEKKGGTLCHGLHFLLLGMLLKLGYRGYHIMARMGSFRPSPDPHVITGLEHQAMLLQIPAHEETYFVDIGLNLGFTRPALLKEGHEFEGFAQKRFRLIRGRHAESPLTGADGEEWRFQTNRDIYWNIIPDPGWHTVFAFSEQPYYMKDLENFNWLSNNRPGAFLKQNVVVGAFKRTPDWALLGLVLLFRDKVTLRTEAGVEILRELKSEEERITALKEHCGIVWDPMEATKYIAGRPSALNNGDPLA